MMKLKNQEGFTIVEIITGLMVTALFVIGIGIVVTNLTYINDRAYDLVLINGLVENKVETLRSASFGALSDETVDFSSELPKSIGSPKSATYTISTVSDIDIGSSLKLIEVTIQYTVGRTPESTTFKTHVGELGIGQ